MRLFFAVEIGPPAEEALAEAASAMASTGADVRWSGGPWHLTLAFLGETPTDRLPPAVQAGRRAAGRGAPSRAALSGLGIFESWERPKVLWMGVEGGNLEALAGSLRQELGREGFVPEKREFVPHVTLGRFRSPRGAGVLREKARALLPASAHFEVNEAVLFESRLEPAGPEYRALERLPLGRA